MRIKIDDPRPGLIIWVLLVVLALVVGGDASDRRFMIVFLVGLALYYLPAIIAAFRHHSRLERILTYNTLLGWTGLFWFWLLYEVIWGDAFCGSPLIVEDAWLRCEDRELPCSHRVKRHTLAPMIEGGPFEDCCSEMTGLRVEGYSSRNIWVSVPVCIEHAGKFTSESGYCAQELVEMHRTH
jgi:Superinfection immunity protein